MGIRRTFLISSFIVLLIIFINSYSNVHRGKDVKGVKTVKKVNVIKPSPSPILSPTSTPVSSNTIKAVAKKESSKLYGGWYWNDELNKSQRWMGKDSQGNDIWNDQGDPPPSSQNYAVSNSLTSNSAQQSSNNSSSLPPSELGATITGVGTISTSQNQVKINNK